MPSWKEILIIVVLVGFLFGIGWLAISYAEGCEQRCYHLNQHDAVAYTQCQAKC